MNPLLATAALTAGSLLERAGRQLTKLGSPKPTPFDIFTTPSQRRLDQARLDHLDSLGLDLAGRTVLEVGAGLGSLTEFFEKRGCQVLATEGRRDNVAEMARRYPQRRVERLDLDDPDDLAGLPRLGQFDIVFCYGTLYHLTEPRPALQALAGVCACWLLLETCVTPGTHTAIHPVRESETFDQSIRQVGCRPTRPWIMSTLAEYWGHAYVSRLQPKHKQFEVDWSVPLKHGNHRAVFVGSKSPLVNANLLDALPDRQARLGEAV
jgi:2-polyprenyl-3-methyl-5-hydroxy-6-metoxy-1,4-benzoquinol methylase